MPQKEIYCHVTTAVDRQNVKVVMTACQVSVILFILGSLGVAWCARLTKLEGYNLEKCPERYGHLIMSLEEVTRDCEQREWSSILSLCGSIFPLSVDIRLFLYLLYTGCQDFCEDICRYVPAWGFWCFCFTVLPKWRMNKYMWSPGEREA